MKGSLGLTGFSGVGRGRSGRGGGGDWWRCGGFGGGFGGVGKGVGTGLGGLMGCGRRSAWQLLC